MEAPHLPAPNCQMCFREFRAGPGGAAAFLFSQPRASCGFAAVFSPSGSGGRPIRFFGRRSIRFFVSAACSSSRLPASSCRAAVATRPMGTAPCEELVRGNAMSASHQAPSCPCVRSVRDPRPASCLGAGGNRISRRFRFTEEPFQSNPRVRALRRPQVRAKGSRLRHAAALPCIRHTV